MPEGMAHMICFDSRLGIRLRQQRSRTSPEIHPSMEGAKHGHNANVIEEDLFVTKVDELLNPLPIIKINLLKVGIFPGCNEDFATQEFHPS